MLRYLGEKVFKVIIRFQVVGFAVSAMLYKAELAQISEKALFKIKLSGYEKYYPYQFSDDMKQRVPIVEALA